MGIGYLQRGHKYRYIIPNSHSESLIPETGRHSFQHDIWDNGQNLALVLSNLDRRYYRMSGSANDDFWPYDGNRVSGENRPK